MPKLNVAAILAALISITSFGSYALSMSTYKPLKGTATKMHNWEKAIEHGYISQIGTQSKNDFKKYFKSLVEHSNKADTILADKEFYKGVKNAIGEVCGQFYRREKGSDYKLYIADSSRSSVWTSQGTPFLETGDIEIQWPLITRRGSMEYVFFTTRMAGTETIEFPIHSRGWELWNYNIEKESPILTLKTKFFKTNSDGDRNGNVLPNDASLYSVYILPKMGDITSAGSETNAYDLCYNNSKALLPPAYAKW